MKIPNNYFYYFQNSSILLSLLVTLFLGITACNQQNQSQENISNEVRESDLTLKKLKTRLHLVKMGT